MPVFEYENHGRDARATGFVNRIAAGYHQNLTMPISDAQPDPAINPAPMWRTWAMRAGILLVIAAGVVYAAQVGLRFRYWMWETAAPIRNTADTDRAFFWGRQAALEGYANQYEKMQPERPADLNWLDYPPLRLGVLTLWARWAMTHYPAVKQWHQHPSFELTEPLLWFNLFMEAIGVGSAFLLVRLWARRAPPHSSFILPPSSFFRGWLPGLFAAAILWFNPAIVVSAYGWPAADLWIVPMFLLAALLASTNWWFTAGVIIGIGAMLKGQQLLAVPVFLIWAIIVGRPISAIRMLAGVTVAVAVIASPWLLTYVPADKLAVARVIQSERQPALVPDGTFAIPRVCDVWAIIWVAGIWIAAMAMPFVGRLRFTPSTGLPLVPARLGEGESAVRSLSHNRAHPHPNPLPEHRERGQEEIALWQQILSSQWTFPALAVIATVILVSWPWMLKDNRPQWLIGACAGLALAAAVRWVRPRGIPAVAAGAVGTAMLLCMSVFHGSPAWLDCGIRFGTIHTPVLAVGKSDNLPGILRNQYDWSDDLTTTALTLPAHSVFSFWSAEDVNVAEGPLLRAVFITLLALSAIGIGLHARRRDPRFLIAIVTPWLMLFCFAPQVHERYLLFAAGVSCVCAGISTGMTLLGVLLSIIASLMTLHQMLAGASRANLRLLGDSLHEQFPSLFDRQAGQLLLRIGDGTHPDLGFAVVLIGLVFLYFTLAMRRPAPRIQSPLST